MVGSRHAALLLVGASLTLLAASRPADARSFYVDANRVGATDSNPGTSSQPWATIAKAAATLVGGDTVLVRAGTYYQTRTDNSRYLPVLNPANSGTATAPITFRAYPGDAVIITYAPGVTGTGPLIGSYRKNWVVWDGFIIQEVAANYQPDTGPVVIFGFDAVTIVDHVTIQNCDIRAVVVTYQDNHNALRLENDRYCTIRNNKIHGVGDGWGVTPNHTGLTAYNTKFATIEHNEVYDNCCGIFIKGPHDPVNDNVVIRYNLIHDNQIGVRMSFTYNTQVYQNIIRDGHSYNANTIGVQYAETCAGTDSTSCAVGYGWVSNRDVYNNTMYNLWEGIEIAGLPDRLTGRGNDWRNNIFSSTHYPILVGPTTPFGEILEYDFRTDYNDYVSYTAFREHQADQSFSQWRANTTYDANSLISDPLFVSVTGRDFHLLSTSPMIGGCTDWGDLNGNGSTTDRINIGAYVTGLEVIGPTTAPSNPLDALGPSPVKDLRAQ